MADTTSLKQSVADLATQVAATVGGEDSAEVLIQGIGDRVTAAVTKALQDNDAADQTSIDAATAAIKEQIDAAKASAGKLADAVAANPST